MLDLLQKLMQIAAVLNTFCIFAGITVLGAALLFVWDAVPTAEGERALETPGSLD